MKRQARDLADQEKDIFTEEFYDLCEKESVELCDQSTPMPYGCPWMWGSKIELEGDNIKEMAKNLFDDYKEEIQEALYADMEF